MIINQGNQMIPGLDNEQSLINRQIINEYIKNMQLGNDGNEWMKKEMVGNRGSVNVLMPQQKEKPQEEQGGGGGGNMMGGLTSMFGG